MSFQAYIDNVKAKTGKTPEDFAQLAAEKGLSRHAETVAWLKNDFELGHGHATAVIGVILKAGLPKPTKDQKFDALFAGKKQRWRAAVSKLIEQISEFGDDVSVAPGGTYINLLRAQNKFGIVQPSSTERLDIGIKLKGKAAHGRSEPAGSWNAMVRHRIRVADPKEIDTEVLSALRSAYEAAKVEQLRLRLPSSLEGFPGEAAALERRLGAPALGG